MRCLALLLLLSACGGPPAEHPEESTPVVEVGSSGASGPVALEIAGDEEPREDSAKKSDVEVAEACIDAMREGRGLPDEERPSPESASYQRARAAERAGKRDEMRRAYLAVVRDHPASRYVPLVYFAFGEIFRREAEKDPSKRTLAVQSYREAMKYPAPESTAWVSATLRLAELEQRGGRGAESLALLKKIADLHARDASAVCARESMPLVRTRMVVVFADVGRPSTAFEFFRRSSGERPPEHVAALGMVASLAATYAEKQRHEDAAAALLSVSQGPAFESGFCKREEHIVDKLAPLLPYDRRMELIKVHMARCVPH